MKKIVFLIFLLFVLLLIPKGADALVVYEATVTVTSIKVPERGAQMPHYYGYDFTNAEFRISTMPYIVVKDPLGNVQSKRWFNGSGGPGIYFDAGDKTSFTFRHDGTGKFSIYINFPASTCTGNDKCYADCTTVSPATPQYCMMLEYYSPSGWAYASCPSSCGRGLYVGTSPDVWFKVAEI